MKRQQFGNDWIFCEKGKEEMAVFIPHDATQYQGRDEAAPSGTGGGYYLGGRYVYRKKFVASEEWVDQTVSLEFEGVYPNAAVFLNGKEIGGCRYGYTCFRTELKDLVYGEENEILVEVDNTGQPNSRWYAGAGIYRPVWLLTGQKEHICPDGIRVTTLSCDPAKLLIEVEHTGEKERTQIRWEIYDQGEKVASGEGDQSKTVLSDARLWNAEHPFLYECRAYIYRGEMLLDSDSTMFGIRKLEWSPKGFFVNGESVLLKGGCVHHDNGILGARSFAQSEWRRIKKLKEYGFNAIRSAHNPMCRAALDACDALGMYVLDETWDMWYKAKTSGDYAKNFMDHYERDLKSIVEKDYNHPSVIMYSIGNEVTEPAEPEGVRLAEKIRDRLHQMDDTRPVTAGINLTLLLMAQMEKNPELLQAMGGGEKRQKETTFPEGEMNSTAYNEMVAELGNRMTLAAATPAADQVASPVLDLLDIAGYNYADSRYETEGDLHPDRIVLGTETYTYDLAKRWSMVEKYPYLIGDFMWTAWDYVGEAGIGSWSYDREDRGLQNKKYPWLLSGAGALDILGNETAPAGAAAVTWGKRKTPYIAVSPVNALWNTVNSAIWRGSNGLPHWSYQGCEGHQAKVQVYSKAREIELFVNDVSQGRKKTDQEKAEFFVNYEPGELKAAAYDENGTVMGESVLRSARGMVGIHVSVERQAGPNPENIVYLDISLTGENGEVECNRDTLLTISLEGAELLAFGSAKAKTEETFLSESHTTYYGKSQAVIRMKHNHAKITVSGENLKTVTKEIYQTQVRPYCSGDHDQVQGICLSLADDPAFQSKRMQQLLLNAFCNYYIEQEPQNCFVGVDGDRVAGYIVCAENTKKWAKEFPGLYVPDWDENPMRMFYEGCMASPLKYADCYPAHLHIDLLPRYQRQGLGTRLMDMLIAHLKQRGVPGVMLSVANDNENARQFYRKYGFQIIEITDMETVMGMGWRNEIL